MNLSLHKHWVDPMFVERQVSHFWCEQKMMSFRGQASWAKMTSPGGKLTALAHHPTNKQIKLHNEPITLQTLGAPIEFYHIPDGVTNLKYKLLHFLTTNFFSKRERHQLLTWKGAAIQRSVYNLFNPLCFCSTKNVKVISNICMALK